MTRIFVTADQISGQKVTIQGGDAHHLAVVLRKNSGDDIVAIGPDGTEHTVRLQQVARHEVVGAILTSVQPQREPQTKVTLVQALLKGTSFDWVVQKGTEVGMARLVPFMSARTVVKLPENRRVARQQRWQRIATAAAQQSGRSRVPEVAALHDLSAVKELVAQTAAQGGLVLLAWEGETDVGLFERLAAWQPPATQGLVLLVVGPEGGFQQDEVQQLTAAGAETVTLGPLIFRADTAGLAFLLMTLYHLGDLGRASQRRTGPTK